MCFNMVPVLLGGEFRSSPLLTPTTYHPCQTIYKPTGISVYMCMSSPAGPLNFNTPSNFASQTQLTFVWYVLRDSNSRPID